MDPRDLDILARLFALILLIKSSINDHNELTLAVTASRETGYI
jgi:hypothetical protein